MKVYTKNICQNFFFGPPGDDGTAVHGRPIVFTCGSHMHHSLAPNKRSTVFCNTCEHHFSHIMTLGTKNSKVVPLHLT